MKPLHLGLALAATPAVALVVAPASAQGGKSGVERLYILNCGEGVVGDISRWSPGVNVGKSMDFVDSCYLIKHGQGWLLWDTGVADAIAATPEGQRPADARGPLWRRPKTLAAQIDQLGVKPSDIKYVAISHSHPDHIGNVTLFPQSMLLAQKAEYEWPSPLGPGFKPDHPVTKLEGDHDVFGDGSVMIISTPGHTPGHQSLLVKLPKTGGRAALRRCVPLQGKLGEPARAGEQRQQGQDRRLDAAHGGPHGEGKGAALDESRQGAARRPEDVARVLRASAR
jgi:N-acyl homoserine lactone hydrolase